MIDRGIFRISGVRNVHLRNKIGILNFARNLKIREPNFLHLSSEAISRKHDVPVTEAKGTIIDPVAISTPQTSDRIFPLDTIEIKNFNEKHDLNVENAIIHIGSDADYYARAWNLLAFVVKDNIYFRSNKFNTTTEEGRKLLYHELAHVAQNENKVKKDKEELELEAQQAETWEVFDPDPPEKITLDRSVYYLRKSEQKKVIHMTANSVISWIEREKYSSNEREYLQLLINYDELITGNRPICKGRTEADRRMDQELKRELRLRS